MRRYLSPASALRRNPWLGHGFGLVAFGVALALRFSLQSALPPGFPYLTFFPAVILTTFLAGTRPGLLCGLLSGLAAWYWFVPPFGSFLVSYNTAIALAFYVFIVGVDIWVIDGMVRAMDRVEQNAGELAQTSALLSLIGDSSPDMIYAKDVQSRVLYANAVSEKVIGKPLDQIVNHSDLDWAASQAEAEAILANDDRVIRDGEMLDVDEKFTGDDGQTRHYRSLKAPLRDASGAIIGLVGITSDVTDRRMAEERERLLAREVDHRAKNLLAVVQSVVQLTRANDVASFKAAIEGRIHSLARAHSLLARARWEGVNFRQLVDEELAAFSGRDARLRVEGPPLHLKPEVAQSLALVVHELATNAAKYGALSKDAGEVQVRWSLAEDAGKISSFEFCWHEQGGPEVSPPKHKGFGSTVIRSTIERQLKGKVSLDWRADGLLCTLTVPADHLSAAPNAKVNHKPEAEKSGIDANKAISTERRVLIVEDEVLIAAHLEQALAEAGHHVIGPASDVGGAVKLVLTEDVDFAVLDVNLAGEHSFPIADVLNGKGIPFVFSTGYGGSIELPERFQGVGLLTKPSNPRELLQMINNEAVQQRPSGQYPQ